MKPSKSRPTLLIGLRALVYQELAVTDKILNGLDDVSFNGHSVQ